MACETHSPGKELAPQEVTSRENPKDSSFQRERSSTAETSVEPITEPGIEKKEEPTIAPKEPLQDAGQQEPNVPERQPEPQPEQMVESTKETSSSSVTVQIQHAEDVLASYLLSGSAWNIFYGKTVPLGRHSNTQHTSYHTAFRFRDVPIPQGATILSARLSFQPHNEVDSKHRLMLNIYAERSDNSNRYNPKDYKKGRPDQRLKTRAKIDRWIVRCRSDCSSDVRSPRYEYDCPQRKRDCWKRTLRYTVPKDLKQIVRELVSQPGWKSGHALSLFLFNAASDREGKKYQDSRTLIGWDASQPSKAPQLVIEYR